MGLKQPSECAQSAIASLLSVSVFEHQERSGQHLNVTKFWRELCVQLGVTVLVTATCTRVR